MQDVGPDYDPDQLSSVKSDPRKGIKHGLDSLRFRHSLIFQTGLHYTTQFTGESLLSSFFTNQHHGRTYIEAWHNSTAAAMWRATGP